MRIKQLLLLPALMLLSLVAACTPTLGTTTLANAVTTPVPAVAAQTILDEKALVGVEAAALLANNAASIAVDTGVLRPGSPQAIQVADLLVKVREAVLLARQAHTAGNATLAAQRMAAALGLIGQAQALIR